MSGPIIRNRWGYLIEYEHEAQDENAFINAIILDPATQLQRQFLATALTPASEHDLTIRTNFLIAKNHTFGVWYNYERESAENQGVDGGLQLRLHLLALCVAERGAEGVQCPRGLQGRLRGSRGSVRHLDGVGEPGQLGLDGGDAIAEVRARSLVGKLEVPRQG